MKIRKFISIIVLTIIITLGITFSSLATDDSIVENENTNNNVEDNVEDDLENNEENTEGSNENNNENNDSENTEDDETGSNDNNDNSNNNNSEDDNIESDDNNNQENTENNDDNKNNSGNKKPTKPNKNDKEETDKNQDDNKQTDDESKKEETTVEKNPTESNQTSSNNNVIETESENANLRTLILNVEGLSPEFDKNITEYYLIVDLSVENIDIEAYPEDENSIILSIDGNTDLQEGQNTIKIVVRAEAGNTKTYVINVTKTDDVELVNANLKSLSVKGFNFYPSFKNNIYNYNLTINEKISQLEIMAETENEEATYKILGNENLGEGDNLIKIIVTAQDGETKREYKINVFMSSKSVELQKTSKTPAIVLLCVLGVAIVATAIAISKKH